MRLTPHEITSITSVIKKHLGEVEIYLFGSRVDDNARGGDIDILIIGDGEIERKIIGYIRFDLWEQIGEQKIDLLYQQQGQLTPFAELAKMKGVLL
ncbi:MAG: nucleotidyltransferase domain-containing protein [Ignavibacteriae bacterium]|nr:nucleotidyltransferase domain-containing protein [Ignavibacteriota bacterium]